MFKKFFFAVLLSFFVVGGAFCQEYNSTYSMARNDYRQFELEDMNDEDQRAYIAALCGRMFEVQKEIVTISHYQLLVVSFLWGSVLYLVYVQR